MIHFGHRVILTIVGTWWDDPHPGFFKDGQKPVRAALTFFNNLWAITAPLLVKGLLGQVRQRSYESAWPLPCAVEDIEIVSAG